MTPTSNEVELNDECKKLRELAKGIVSNIRDLEELLKDKWEGDEEKKKEYLDYKQVVLALNYLREVFPPKPFIEMHIFLGEKALAILKERQNKVCNPS